MPVNQKKMDALQKTYGAAKGKDIYYAMENKGRKKPISKPIPKKPKGY